MKHGLAFFMKSRTCVLLIFKMSYRFYVILDICPIGFAQNVKPWFTHSALRRMQFATEGQVSTSSTQEAEQIGTASQPASTQRIIKLKQKL